MKKTIALILVLCLCLALCACSQSTTAETPERNYNPQSYIGVWENTDYGYDSFPQSIFLFSNGKCIIDPSRNNWTIDDEPWGLGGEWMVEGNHLVVFYDESTDAVAYMSAYNFELISDTEIKLGVGTLSLTYTKK